MLHPSNYHCTAAPDPEGPDEKKKRTSTQRGPQKFHATVNFILRDGASRTPRFPFCTTVFYSATSLLLYHRHCIEPLLRSSFAPLPCWSSCLAQQARLLSPVLSSAAPHFCKSKERGGPLEPKERRERASESRSASDILPQKFC